MWSVFWPLFGASNQLLAALTLVGVTVWLWRTRRAWWVFLVAGIPAVLMYVMSSQRLSRSSAASSPTASAATSVAWIPVTLIALAVLVLHLKSSAGAPRPSRHAGRACRHARSSPRRRRAEVEPVFSRRPLALPSRKTFPSNGSCVLLIVRRGACRSKMLRLASNGKAEDLTGGHLIWVMWVDESRAADILSRWGPTAEILRRRLSNPGAAVNYGGEERRCGPEYPRTVLFRAIVDEAHRHGRRRGDRQRDPDRAPPVGGDLDRRALSPAAGAGRGPDRRPPRPVRGSGRAERLSTGNGGPPADLPAPGDRAGHGSRLRRRVQPLPRGTCGSSRTTSASLATTRG